MTPLNIRVLALDLSLTSTGWCWQDDTGELIAGTINPKTVGTERLAHIRDRVLDLETESGCGLVAIEGYAYARPNQAHQIGELGGVIRTALHDAGIEWVTVAPSSIKQYATGKGNANKDLVRDAARDVFGLAAGVSSDVCDAVWLWALTRHALGFPEVARNGRQRAAIVSVGESLGVCHEVA